MDVDARVYGSLSWQAVSGLSYVHSGSDIDLVCEVSAPDQLPKLIQLLKTEAQKLDRRLDGEIRFPDGSAVAWLELANVSGDPAAELLIKSNADTRMARVSEIESFFREKPDAC
jgi:phosphoribosyl-dephospho-CoA transferase